jgi:heme/copper-type cytochrome/quinol oxidase subunit 2
MMSLFKSVLTFALVMIAPSLFACAACTGGKTDSAMAQGMNAGIFLLMGVIVSVLIGVASVGFYIVRRTSRLAQLTGNQPVAQPTI